MDMKKALYALGLKKDEIERLVAVEESANEDELRLMRIMMLALQLGNEVQRLCERAERKIWEERNKPKG